MSWNSGEGALPEDLGGSLEHDAYPFEMGYPFGEAPSPPVGEGWYPWEPPIPQAWGTPQGAAVWETEYPVGSPPSWEPDYLGHEMSYPGEFEHSTPVPPPTPLARPSMQAARPPQPRTPLKVVCVGPTFSVGGVREHALALARFLDPSRVRISEFVVTEMAGAPRGSSHPRMPAPVTVADSETLERVSRECDVLLMWGSGFNDRLSNNQPLRVFLAHGETWWTRNALIDSSRVVDHVIAVSERVRRSICNGFPVTTILNGVDSARLGQTAAREELRRRYAFGDGDFVVGSVGRLTREKQFHLLIESLARLPERFKLLLVGSGRRQGELLSMANRRIPGRYVITAADNYLGDYYAAMDAFAMVSAHEGFGLVLAEAMMCGRPVVSTHVGCAPEVIRNRVNGVIVQPHPDSVAQSLSLLHEHPRWADGLAREGQRYANTHLHAARMAREYEDLLLRLQESRRRRGGDPR